MTHQLSTSYLSQIHDPFVQSDLQNNWYHRHTSPIPSTVVLLRLGGTAIDPPLSDTFSSFTAPPQK